MGIKDYVLKRIVLVIPTLIGVSICVFLLIHLIPGDPAAVMLFPKGTPEQIAELRMKLGLDQPLYLQYFKWLGKAVVLDLGDSVKTGEPVLREILNRFPATIELSATALLLAIIIGIPLGVVAAQKRNSIIDYFCTSISLFGVSVPVFWLGLMLIYLFSVKMGVLPVSGRITVGESMFGITGFYLIDSLLAGNSGYFIDAVKHLALPAIALSTVPLALIVRVTRSSMLDVLSEDYIRTARAKGVPYKLVIFKHALKNALIPIVTVIGLEFGGLMGGTILTETVFSWPGIGSYTVWAIFNRDYPSIQGIIFVVALLFILINLFVDILYAYIDPRIRYD